jgi:hypothetical protein
MPVYMDRHDFAGVSAEDIAAAHLMDLEVQEQFGVPMHTPMATRRLTMSVVEIGPGRCRGLSSA